MTTLLRSAVAAALRPTASACLLAARALRLACLVPLSLFALAGSIAWSGNVPALPTALAADESTWFITWSATMNGSGPSSDGKVDSHIDGRHIPGSGKVSGSLRGSEVLHVTPDGNSYAFPVQLTATLDAAWYIVACDVLEGRLHITEPNRWNGTRANYPGVDFKPFQRPDGHYYIPGGLLGIITAYPGSAPGERRAFPAVFHQSRGCSGSDEYSHPVDSSYYDDKDSLFADLEGDTTGTTFSLHKTIRHTGVYWNYQNDFPITIEWNIAVRRLGKCATQQGPLDENDPIVTSEDVSLEVDNTSIQPDGQTKLHLSVSCDRVPVKNAQVEIKAEAKKNSGGHNHDNAAHPRPRGYLNGTKLTEERPSIQVKTDDTGRAVVTFKSGRDTKSEQIGIAGIYELTAKSVKFPDRKDTKSVTAETKGFTPLVAGAGYQLVGATDKHRLNHYGTAATLTGIANLASDFQQAQQAHNLQLMAQNKTPWPTYTIHVNDISLVQGGLFDVFGRDIMTGQWHGQDWQPPHYDHLLGRGVDMNTSQWGTGARHNWLVATLRSLGSPTYGTWANEPTLHLNFKQTAAALDHLFKIVRLPWSLAGPPDLHAVLFEAAPNDLLQAAPGQQLTLTAGVDNLNGSGEAHDVALALDLPASLDYVSADPPPTRVDGARHLVWILGTLEPHALPQTFDVVAQVASGAAPGSTLTVNAGASASEQAAGTGNNRDTLDLFVQPPGPDLVVRSDLDAVALTVGRPLTFTVEVANLGNAPAAGAVLNFTLPTSVTLQSEEPVTATASAHSATWNLGELAPDAAQTVTVAVSLATALSAQISADPGVIAPGLLTFTLDVKSPEADIDPDNNSLEVVKPVQESGSDLAVWLDRDAANPGETLAAGDVIYSLRYANLGNEVAATTTLTLSLGAGLSVANAQPAATRTTTSEVFTSGVLAWDLGSIGVGGGGELRVRLHAASALGDAAALFANIAAGGTDLEPANNAVFLSGPALLDSLAFVPNPESGTSDTTSQATPQPSASPARPSASPTVLAQQPATTVPTPPGATPTVPGAPAGGVECFRGLVLMLVGILVVARRRRA